MTAIRVTDALSNTAEHIVEAAKVIGRSKLKRKIFEAVYHHKKRVKSVPEIAEMTGLTKMQVLQAGGQLKSATIVEQTRKNGKTAYGQIEFFQHNKHKILRLVDNPEKIKDVPTKRNQTKFTVKGLSFVKKRTVTKAKRVSHKSKNQAGRKVRIAFLTTNPDERSSLRTDIEARDVGRAIQRSQNRDLVDVRYIPAAELRDLLDVLNDFRPNIIHFSGHGGDGALLFDNKTADDNGGVELDFGLVNEVVSATNEPPVLLVFNACDTLDGAEIFLKTVSAVVAMSSSISDSAACFFSEQFYSAIAGGQSVGHALKQGKLVLKAAKLPDADLPTIVSQVGVDPEQLRFID